MEYLLTFGIFAILTKKTKIGKFYLNKFGEKINYGKKVNNYNYKITTKFNLILYIIYMNLI
jgi:hypothetical protein